jgi:triacylglycerol esterase/lipase EstA (alpha/beta hydrolase family)
MNPLEQPLEEAGYIVVNVSYPSTSKPIEELAPIAVGLGIDACPADTTVHFVTHSLGGILVRYYLAHNSFTRLGRTVMLAPPNQGSEVVDSLGGMPGFRLINGPAGLQLGTDEESVPMSLGPVEYEVGVIAGTQTINPILSLYLPNPDDGKMSMERTRVEGMADFISVPHSHPMLMRSSTVIEQVIAFLKMGEFDRVAL